MLMVQICMLMRESDLEDTQRKREWGREPISIGGIVDVVGERKKVGSLLEISMSGALSMMLYYGCRGYIHACPLW